MNPVPAHSSWLPICGTLCPSGKSKFLLGYSRLTVFIVVLDREQRNCACTSMCCTTLELFLWSTPQIYVMQEISGRRWRLSLKVKSGGHRTLIASLPQLKKWSPNLICVLHPSLPVPFEAASDWMPLCLWTALASYGFCCFFACGTPDFEGPFISNTIKVVWGFFLKQSGGYKEGTWIGLGKDLPGFTRR